jgi:hypothetical protein
MSREPVGQAANWRRMQARNRRDADAAKMVAAFRASHPPFDGERMLAELAEDVRAIEAGQRARDQRNAGKAAAAYARYEAARARFAGERDAAEGPSLLVAAAMGLPRPGIQIF